MPWKTKDVGSKTKAASTPQQKRLWVRVANKVLRDTGDERQAVRVANAAVRKSK